MGPHAACCGCGRPPPACCGCGRPQPMLRLPRRPFALLTTSPPPSAHTGSCARRGADPSGRAAARCRRSRRNLPLPPAAPRRLPASAAGARPCGQTHGACMQQQQQQQQQQAAFAGRERASSWRPAPWVRSMAGAIPTCNQLQQVIQKGWHTVIPACHPTLAPIPSRRWHRWDRRSKLCTHMPAAACACVPVQRT